MQAYAYKAKAHNKKVEEELHQKLGRTKRQVYSFNVFPGIFIDTTQKDPTPTNKEI